MAGIRLEFCRETVGFPGIQGRNFELTTHVQRVN